MTMGRNKVIEAAQRVVDAWNEEHSYSEITQPRTNRAIVALEGTLRAAAESAAPTLDEVASMAKDAGYTGFMVAPASLDGALRCTGCGQEVAQ